MPVDHLAISGWFVFAPHPGTSCIPSCRALRRSDRDVASLSFPQRTVQREPVWGECRAGCVAIQMMSRARMGARVERGSQRLPGGTETAGGWWISFLPTWIPLCSRRLFGHCLIRFDARTPCDSPVMLPVSITTKNLKMMTCAAGSFHHGHRIRIMRM